MTHLVGDNYVRVLKSGQWSKSKAFLLPLTRIDRNDFDVQSYLFWESYSIENYQLIVKFTYGARYDDFMEHCNRFIFPIWDKGGYLIESYDFEGETVFVLDISVWAEDIEKFLKGKYSRFSKMAKDIISEYHSYYEKGIKTIDIDIKGILNPTAKYGILNNQTAIEYVAEEYGLPLEPLLRLGELGSIYDIKEETLTDLPVKIAEKI
jgi:hypothetical protein